MDDMNLITVRQYLERTDINISSIRVILKGRRKANDSHYNSDFCINLMVTTDPFLKS